MTFARLQLQFESTWHLVKSFHNISKTWKSKTNKRGWFIFKKKKTLKNCLQSPNYSLLIEKNLSWTKRYTKHLKLITNNKENKGKTKKDHFSKY